MNGQEQQFQEPAFDERQQQLMQEQQRQQLEQDLQEQQEQQEQQQLAARQGWQEGRPPQPQQSQGASGARQQQRQPNLNWPAGTPLEGPPARRFRGGKFMVVLLLIGLAAVGLWYYLHQGASVPKRLPGMGLFHGAQSASVQESQEPGQQESKPALAGRRAQQGSAAQEAPGDRGAPADPVAADAQELASAQAPQLKSDRAVAPAAPAMPAAPEALASQAGSAILADARTGAVAAPVPEMAPAARTALESAPPGAAPAAAWTALPPGALPAPATVGAAAAALESAAPLPQGESLQQLLQLQQRVQKLEDAIVAVQTRLEGNGAALSSAAAGPSGAGPVRSGARPQRARWRRSRAARASAAQPALAPDPQPPARPALGAQLLSIDLWNGTPSVVVTSGLPGDTRTRTLRPGDTLNGVTLRSANPATGQATFVSGGQRFTLSLGNGD